MIYLVTKQKALWKSDRYVVINVEESLKLLEPLKIVELDTETMGLDPFTKELLTVQLGCAEFQVVIDCTSIDIHQYKDYLESDRLFLGWNIKFDLKFLYHQRILPIHVYDGYLAEKLQWLGYPTGMHEMSLKAACLNYLGEDMDKTVRGKIIKTGLTEDVVVYAAGDVCKLGKIRDKQLEGLKAKGLLKAIDFENEFVKCLAYIEYSGARLDVPRWKRKMASDLDTLNTSEKELNEWVEDPTKCSVSSKYCSINAQGDLFSGFDTKPRCHINWSSSKQVVPILEDLGLNCKVLDKKTKKYKKSADIKVIEPQADKSEIVSYYIKYKKAKIIVDTFGEKFLKLINPITGRIHANFNQLGTDTGRLSSTEPNLQNLPHDKETRACFAASEGNKWISADYTGQESYLMASISNDKAMLDELINGSGDMHSLTAKMVFLDIPRETPLTDIKKLYHDKRQEAKGYEFCFNYGGQDSTLVRNYGLTPARAKEIYNNYMSGFAGLKRYQDYRRWDVMQKGYILLNAITGHKSFVHNFADIKTHLEKQQDPDYWAYYNEMKRDAPDCDTVQNHRKYSRIISDCQKHSINYPIQGTGALCFKLASIKLFNWLKKNDLLFKVHYCIPVHDELNLEAPNNVADEVADILVKCMVSAGKPFCTRAPLGADVEIGQHWIH